MTTSSCVFLFFKSDRNDHFVVVVVFLKHRTPLEKNIKTSPGPRAKWGMTTLWYKREGFPKRNL